MRKFTLLIVLFVLVINVRTKSQTIELIPKLNPSHIGFISDYKPIFFNGNMYFFYSTFNFKNNLAKYDGTTITLIPNLDTNDYGCYGEIIVYNNELYFGYNKSGIPNIHYLAKFNGNSLSIINNLNTVDEGYYGSPVVYNNELYFYYRNQNGNVFLAKKNGNIITLIPNLNTSDLGVHGNTLVFNNKLYLGYIKYPVGRCLAEYNGTSYTIISNPVPDNEENGFAGYIFSFQNSIIYTYWNGLGSISIVKYNGNNTSLIPYEYRGHVIHNNNLYYRSPQDYWENTNRLAKYDGNSVTLYPNIDSNDIGIMGNIVVFNNDIYFKYVNSKSFLAKLNGNTISLITNPNTNSYGFCNQLFVYGNSLYGGYYNPNIQIARFNGNNISLLQNPDTLDMGYWGLPFQFNNSLYFKYCVSTFPEEFHLARFTDSTVTVGKPLLNDNSISLYPNPATNQLTIQNLKKASNICIFDINGRMLFDEIVEENKQINISHLAKGVYIVKLRNDAEVSFRKFIKE